MSELDKKIIVAVFGEPFNPDMPMPSFVDNIKQVFADAGYVQTDVMKKADHLLQDMVNMHANMHYDLLRLGLTSSTPMYVGPDAALPRITRTPEELKAISKEWSKPRMTGQEWYDRFTNEMGEAATNCYGCSCVAMTAAKKVAGIE